MKVNVILKSLICAVSFYTASVSFGSCEYDFAQYFDNTFAANAKKKVFRANAPKNFNAKIENGRIEIPLTLKYDNYGAPFVPEYFDVEDIIEVNKNWKFVLVEGDHGFSLRVGEKKLFKKQVVNPDTIDEYEMGLHHPTLAGFDHMREPNKVVAAGLIDRDEKTGRIHFLIDSGNYGLDLEKVPDSPVVRQLRARALVNLYHFFYDQGVTTHFKKVGIKVKDKKSKEKKKVNTSVLVLGL